MSSLWWRTKWYYWELTQPRLNGRRGLGMPCDHMWGDRNDTYSLDLTLVQVWRFSISRCDHCKTKTARWARKVICEW